MIGHEPTPPRTGSTEPPPLRALLRAATQAAHERLHLHDGFASIQDGTIDLARYRKLLLRLYGFHVPFEAASGSSRDRSIWLEQDLSALDARPFAAGQTPLCPRIPKLDTPSRRLGARYVTEGAALGGRQLARNLDRLLGVGVVEGRRFFVGRRSGTGDAWQAYLAGLASASGATARQEVVAAAVETFAAFEEWLTGWSKVDHG